MNQNISETFPENAKLARTIYILLILDAVLFCPIFGFIGVIIAQVKKTDAPEWLQSHYQFQIRTFYISLLYIFIAVVLLFIFIGVFVLLFWLVWQLVRSIKGIKLLKQHKEHPNPTSWWF